MPDVEARLEFLSRLPLYETEKPFYLLPWKGSGLDPDEVRLNNLEFEQQSCIKIRDMRTETHLSVECSGFEFCEHNTAFRSFSSTQDLDGYAAETETLLSQRLSSIYVHTYDVRLRRNEVFGRREVDLNDKMTVEGPARGAHVGTSEPTCLPDLGALLRFRCYILFCPRDHPAPSPRGGSTDIPTAWLSDQTSQVRPCLSFAELLPESRSTWRPLNDTLEDRPLAICDPRTIASDDLVAADRILPDRVGEVYYLHHSPAQQWYATKSRI